MKTYSSSAVAHSHPKPLARKGDMMNPPAVDVPVSVEAEQALLGMIMIEPEAIMRLMDVLDISDFYRDTHRWIYAAALSLARRQERVDSLTMAVQLQRDGRLADVGDEMYLTRLLNCAAGMLHADHYAAIVQDKARRRRLIKAAEQIAMSAYDEKREFSAIGDEAERTVFQVTQASVKAGFKHISGAVLEFSDYLSELQERRTTLTGVPSGLIGLDQLLGGFQKSDLVTIAARPGVGKTSLLLTAGLHAARHGVSVGIVSLEMGKLQIVQRLVSQVANVDLSKLRNGALTRSEALAANDAQAVVYDLPIYYEDTPGLPIGQVRAAARKLYTQTPFDLLLVDYLGLMVQSSRDVIAELGDIMKGLKNLARELNIPVLVAAQMNREIEKENREPRLSDLRDSGHVEQDSDIVMFPWRPGAAANKADASLVEPCHLIVAKHRNGPTGKVDVGYYKPCARFVNPAL